MHADLGAGPVEHGIEGYDRAVLRPDLGRSSRLLSIESGPMTDACGDSISANSARMLKESGIAG